MGRSHRQRHGRRVVSAIETSGFGNPLMRETPQRRIIMAPSRGELISLIKQRGLSIGRNTLLPGPIEIIGSVVHLSVRLTLHCQTLKESCTIVVADGDTSELLWFRFIFFYLLFYVI